MDIMQVWRYHFTIQSILEGICTISDMIGNSYGAQYHLKIDPEHAKQSSTNTTREDFLTKTTPIMV